MLIYRACYLQFHIRNTFRKYGSTKEEKLTHKTDKSLVLIKVFRRNFQFLFILAPSLDKSGIDICAFLGGK